MVRSKQNLRIAAKKAARTARSRREFNTRFGTRTGVALRVITGVASPTEELAFSTRELAAFKANLTRGVYSDFVRVNASGRVTSDSINLRTY